MPLGNLLRVRDGHGHTRVTFVELFFDLVFVFAVTQLSHSLLADLTLSGALHTALLLVALWWVWIDTSWVTNWLDPDRTPVRLALFVIMLLGLTLSAAIPEAFAERGLVFAAALVTIQVGRSIFFIFAVDGDRNHIRNFQRITAWLAFAGVFWIAGGLAEGETRVSLWLIAVVIECIAPATAFWTPGLGRSSTTDWTIEVDHMAERCGLFIIIALGESILVVGATFSELEWTAPVVGAFLGSFVGSVAMWWIYFTTAEAGTAVASSFDDSGRIGRSAYTYMHIPIVAGIIVTAVGDELVLAHPAGHAEPAAVAAIIGGPALYLIGTALFKWSLWGRLSASRLAGLLVLAALSAVSGMIPPLAVSIATTAVLVIVAARDAWLARKSSANGPLSPPEAIRRGRRAETRG